MGIHRFSKGDSVIHAGRPEWGPGAVLSVEGAVHEGKPCERVTIRFARGGLKTISTAFAELRPAASPPAQAHAEQSLNLAERKDAEAALQVLPEDATDPFLGLQKRLAATISLYKDWDSPAGIIDWATRQTGAPDVLAIFTRHELEQHMERYRVALDNHLQKLIRECRKADAAATTAAIAKASPAFLRALRRVDIGR
jgi:hypothetical protein